VAALLLDVTRVLYRRMNGLLPTGIDRVGLEYVRHFGSRSRALLYWRGLSGVLSRADSAALFAALLEPGPDVAALGRRTIARACATGWVPRDLSDHFLFNTAHYGLESRWYAAAARLLGAAPIVAVHDLIPITHPQYCRRGESERHSARMRNALGMARGIVANSRATLEALEEFAARLGLAMPRAVVAPLAPALPRLAPAPRPLEAPYFVVLGTIEPRKNHRLLLEVWQRLAAQLGGEAPRLVVIGQRGWECDDIVQLLGSEALHGLVFELNRCSDAELATWLHHARALLMPSHVEGYGLPVAEGLAAGAPVIAADLPVFREVAGEVPDYADPAHEERWIELVLDYADAGSARRAAQLERMAQHRPATWAQHFRAVDAFLESLATELAFEA
jgi:glycosyltransferase involved in cell wall biosynthesis